jgi:DNA-binding response OmpR family regulator
MEEYEIKPQKIVIVEDNAALAEIYKTRLELIGYECHVASDGEMALQTIEHFKPDLVLLDLMVPKIAGDEILKRMRQNEWGKGIRVYIISNLNEHDAPAGLRQLGIEGYTVKANLSDDDIDKLVDNILKPKEQTESVSLEGSKNAFDEQPSYQANEPPKAPQLTEYEAPIEPPDINLSSEHLHNNN